MSDSLFVRFTTHPAFAWWIRNVASRLDPLVFRATNGRLTSFGPSNVPMLTLTTRGRRSGELRSVHLACVPDGDDWLVVASAMGQERHPAWRYNLEAHPEAEVQVPGARYRVRAEMLADAERDARWPALVAALPQLAVYSQRTDRNIRVFRLRRAVEAFAAERAGR